MRSFVECQVITNPDCAGRLQRGRKLRWRKLKRAFESRQKHAKYRGRHAGKGENGGHGLFLRDGHRNSDEQYAKDEEHPAAIAGKPVWTILFHGPTLSRRLERVVSRRQLAADDVAAQLDLGRGAGR